MNFANFLKNPFHITLPVAAYVSNPFENKLKVERRSKFELTARKSQFMR